MRDAHDTPGIVAKTVVSRDGAAIAFDRAGEGPALILLAGATADRSAETSPATVLSRHCTVFAHDRRGRGDSGDTAPAPTEREIEDLDALIGEGGGPAFVFGHSSGAVLALRAAASGPAIPRLALYEPPCILGEQK